MKRKNMAAMVTSIALVGAVAVGGTLALLSTGPKTLTNTFTAGANYETGDFLLKEHAVAPVTAETTGYPYGSYQKNETVIDGDSTSKKGNTYGEIVPETVLDKDPWFELAHGAKKTPDSWIVARLSKAELYALQQKDITVKTVAVREDLGEDKYAQWQVVTQKGDNWEVGTSGIMKEDFVVTPNPTEDEYIYFIFDRKLVDRGEGRVDRTTALFTQMDAGANAMDVDHFNLVVQGVAVQALNDGTDLRNQGTINAIMTQALSTWTVADAGASD